MCELFFLVMFWDYVAGLVLVPLLVAVVPLMVEQGCSDVGDWHSGARPDGPVWVECDNSLPPTCEF